jgi:NodT family efflux transporter outer membrane factor (OMF) lipoprotein
MTVIVIVAGCTVGPDYHKPADVVPVAYKEGGWQSALPADAMDRGLWWTVFRDPALDRLERQVDISNQNLKAAEANYHEAEAIVTQARAGYFPTAQINAEADRSRSSGTLGRGPGGPGIISNHFSTTLTASWIPDLWGKVRRTVESDIATAQAVAGDTASARLAAQSLLASDYLQLRVADDLKRLLDATAKAYAESLRITRNQYNAGIVAASDVAQAQAQLDNTRAQAIATGILRAQFEHAIAVLIGKPPAALTIAPVAAVPELPVIPAGLPSALLQRRPDIAAAERRMAAANAQIGVAEAAFFPDVTLSADYDTEAERIAKLLSASSRTWSLGANLVQTVFDAGNNQAIVAQKRALFDAAVADYRQTVLTGFQQVEDELSSLRILADQLAAAERALAAAREAERILLNQYKAGTIAYTSVVVAQTAALSDAETVVNIRQSRLLAAVALIEALGGGWGVTQLPTPERIEQEAPLNFNPLPPADSFANRFWDSLPKLW